MGAIEQTMRAEESWAASETVVDGIAERLPQAIISGTNQPGDLERKFGSSHIPIREALRRLQSEGFVEISPRRTAIAAGADLADLANIYDLRRIIECDLRRIIEIEIGRRAVSRMTKRDIETLGCALESFQAVANEPSSKEFWERHRDFHWAILAPAANPTIHGFLIISGKAPNAMYIFLCPHSRACRL
jgi:DNA-binding GntR family transcriptional regulator